MKAPLVSFSGKDCSGCKHLNDRGYCEFTACIIPCTVRATIPEAKPITNADRLRSMTDEELAELIADDWCEVINCPEAPFCNGNCEIHILDWLRQEVNDD